jgi:hypothetical protein
VAHVSSIVSRECADAGFFSWAHACVCSDAAPLTTLGVTPMDRHVGGVLRSHEGWATKVERKAPQTSGLWAIAAIFRRPRQRLRPLQGRRSDKKKWCVRVGLACTRRRGGGAAAGTVRSLFSLWSLRPSRRGAPCSFSDPDGVHGARAAQVLAKSARMINFINYRMRITLADGRVLVGQFMAFDKVRTHAHAHAHAHARALTLNARMGALGGHSI